MHLISPKLGYPWARYQNMVTSLIKLVHPHNNLCIIKISINQSLVAHIRHNMIQNTIGMHYLTFYNNISHTDPLGKPASWSYRYHQENLTETVIGKPDPDQASEPKHIKLEAENSTYFSPSILTKFIHSHRWLTGYKSLAVKPGLAEMRSISSLRQKHILVTAQDRH